MEKDIQIKSEALNDITNWISKDKQSNKSLKEIDFPINEPKLARNQNSIID